MRAQPNAGHYAMVALEQRGMLRGLITQNIDTLHRAGDGGSARPPGRAGCPSRLRCAWKGP
jgi:NAD-dependent SIR2 family protein deacetylase